MQERALPSPSVARIHLRRLLVPGLLLIPTLALLVTLALFFSPVSLQHAHAQEGISLTMTVGRQPNVCATTDSITIIRGQGVFICYVVTNASTVTYDSHIIADISVSPIYTTFDQDLVPGATITKVIVAEIGTTTTRTDTWAAIAKGQDPVQAQDSVTVTVTVPRVEVRQTVGLAAGGCAGEQNITVAANAIVYPCLTLTNTGDTTLITHTLALPAAGIAGATFVMELVPGASITVNNENPRDNVPTPLQITASRAVTSVASVVSVSKDNFSAPSVASTATINIAEATTTLVAIVRSGPNCQQGDKSTTVFDRNQTFHYCLVLTNWGPVTLDRHQISLALPVTSTTITKPLAPNQTMVITNGLLSELRSPMILGPYVAAQTISTTVVVNSSATGGYQSSASSAIVVPVQDPTATFTPSATPTDAPATSTPFPTWTPFPATATWTPFPTWTPTWTPIPPTPTWTRSFELSGLATPTPPGGGFPTTDPLLDPFWVQATADAARAMGVFDSGLPTPAPQFESPLLENAAMFPPETVPFVTETPSPTPTPSLTPSRTPTPTPTPTPTVTPTPTMRPVVLPTGLPPADVAGIFGQVLGSTVASAGLIFLVTGALVFFGVAGAVVGMGFRSNSRSRYELFTLEEEFDEGDGEAEPFDAPRRAARGPAPRPSGRTPPSTADDQWPASLP